MSPSITSALAATYKRAPMEFVRGEGVELIDADGKRYLDFVAGIAVNALGYGDAGLAAAMQGAIESGMVHVSNLYRTAPGEALAEALVAKSFADRVFFCNSGGEANEGAFKFARRWARGQGGTAKHEIFSLRGAFHGRLFGTVAATDRPAYRLPFRPLAGGISILERDLTEIRAAIQSETTAAVIVEPVQGEGGVRVLDAGFLRELRALTTERNILLIFDEIQCGYGRTGSFFAYEQSGVIPDILTVAKPMAGGLPMGAILMRAEVADALQPGEHGTTFGGGPSLASVALHVLERLSDPTLLASVTENGAWFGAQLRALAERHPKVRSVRGVGYMWGVDVTDPAKEVIGRALDLGLLLVSAGEHTLRILPPLVTMRDDLARGLALIERALG
ncbi:MAG: acetylornithine transaminase [Gemmatimonadaceae bacterium]|nr:acetylornithine transaminase [Gemmatimonadaceae bacterium]